MNEQELNRLKEGQKLLRRIENIQKRIDELKAVKFISLRTSKEVKISDDRHFMDDHITEKTVNYNIPINTDDKVPHPFAQPTRIFVGGLISLMDEQKMILQKEFDNL